MRAAKATGRVDAGDVSPAAPHLPDPAARSGHGVGSDPGPGRSPLDRVDTRRICISPMTGSPMSTGAPAELIDATAGILQVSAVAALDGRADRDRAPSGLGTRRRPFTAVGGHCLGLCRSAGRVDASRDRRCRRQHAALLRRVPRHRAPRDGRVRRRAPDPCRRVQAVLRRPPDGQGCPAGTQHDPSTARDVALVLRSDHRVGLARRTDADADLRGRCPDRR